MQAELKQGAMPQDRRALHVIALFEAVKGFAALAALVGVLDLMHRDVRHLAVDLIGRFGFNPDGRYPSLLLHYADLLPDANVHLIVWLGIAYITVRLVEAYGLWNDRSWGEEFGAISGALYLPFEIQHLLHKPSWISAGVFLGNLLMVAFLVYHLLKKRRLKAALQA